MSRVDKYKTWQGQWRFVVYSKNPATEDMAEDLLTLDEAEKLRDDLDKQIGDSYFEDDPRDPSPNCNCGQCPPKGPFTCIRED